MAPLETAVCTVLLEEFFDLEGSGGRGVKSRPQ